MKQTARKQYGFSLIEIMISMVLSLVLIGGVIEIFVANKQTYRMEEALSRTQENARYAVEYLQREIRMAGYFGCNQTTDLYNILKRRQR